MWDLVCWTECKIVMTKPLFISAELGISAWNIEHIPDVELPFLDTEVICYSDKLSGKSGHYPDGGFTLS